MVKQHQPTVRRAMSARSGRALIAAVAIAAVAVAGLVVWYTGRGDAPVTIVEGESVIELSGVAPVGGASVEPVRLNDADRRLPSFRFSNATLVSSRYTVRHDDDLDPAAGPATVVESEEVWSARPQDDVSPDMAVERLARQIETQLSDRMQREMLVSPSADDGDRSISVKAGGIPSAEFPYWVFVYLRAVSDGTIEISTSIDMHPPATFEYSPDDLVPDGYDDRVELVAPLTDIDGIMLDRFATNDSGGFGFQLELENIAGAITKGVDCDEYARAFMEVAEAFERYDPTVVRDDEAFDGATLGVDGERSASVDKIGSLYAGEDVRFSALVSCDSSNSLMLHGTVLAVSF